MNREAMYAVADVIEYADRLDLLVWTTGPKGYESPSTERLWNECGTRGCIAGWVAAWADIQPAPYEWVATVAREFDLADGQAYKLCHNSPGYLWPEDTTDAKATAQLLRDIADGKVEL